MTGFGFCSEAALAGVSGKIPRSVGDLDICIKDNVCAVNFRMAVTCSLSLMVLKLTTLWFRYCQCLVLSA